MASKAIVGEKVGMTQVWDDQNRAVPVTVLKVAPVRVVQVKTPETDGYSALQVTWGFRRNSTLSKPQIGHYAKAGVNPGRALVELRLDDVADYSVGQELAADLWEAGERVDAIAVSKGKGFAGGMKRHNFSGQGASHGNHHSHRVPGAIGACATPFARLQGHPHGGSARRLAGDGAEPRGRLGRRGARARARQGRRSRRPGQCGGPAQLGQDPDQGREGAMTATGTGTERTGSVLRHRIEKERPALVTRTALRRNAAGHDLGTVDLEPTVFGLEPHRAVLHQVVTAQLAAARAGSHSTKTRAEVRGGGAKPFRQKGTGRARQGSSRSPSMSGGGVALGPKPRSYAQHTPKKMVRLALLSALSDRAESGRIVVIDDWKISVPKTKDAATILRKLKLGGSVLVVLAQNEMDVERSFANLPEAQTTTFGELSAHDVLRADWLLFSERTLPGSPSDFSGTHTVEEGEAQAPTAPEEAETAAEEAKAEEPTPAKPRARATKRARADKPETEAETTEGASTEGASIEGGSDEGGSEEADTDA